MQNAYKQGKLNSMRFLSTRDIFLKFMANKLKKKVMKFKKLCT